jgi:hypothetical protein
MLAYFMGISNNFVILWSFGTFFHVLVYWTKINLAIPVAIFAHEDMYVSLAMLKPERTMIKKCKLQFKQIGERGSGLNAVNASEFFVCATLLKLLFHLRTLN